MYDAKGTLRGLRLYIVRYDYDSCLLILLMCTAIHDFLLTESEKSATVWLTLTGLQMRNLTDEV